MDPSEGTPGDGQAVVLIIVIATIGGIITADMWLRKHADTLVWAIMIGGLLTVLGIGYSIVIKNPFRFALALVGGVGLGLFLRGFASMY
jgi:hypothetical protein